MYWDGTQPYKLASLHEKYGPVVRISPTHLSFNTGQAWKDIYGHRSGGKHAFVKDRRYYGPIVPGESDIIRTSDEDHSRVRRILSHSFSDRALKEHDPLLQKWAQLLVQKLWERCVHSSGKAEVDMVSWYNFTTFDVMADLTFAEPLYMLEGLSYSPWVKAIFGSIKMASRVRVIREVHLVGILLNLCLGPLTSKMKNRHNAYTNERVDRRLAKNPERPDIWSHVLRRKDQTAGGLTQAEMYSNASVFMIGSTETTATLLSGLTFLLLTHPEKLELLVREIRTLDSPERLTLEELARLGYLNACLEEGLRCYPPVPTPLPRVIPPEGASVGGYWIPGGTVVSADLWSSCSSSRNLHLPDQCIPERWSSNAPQEFTHDDKSAFNPFSYGPRNCLGKNLAYHEARLLLVNVLWNFDLELVDKENNWMNQGVHFLWDKPELMIRLTPVCC